MNEPRRGDSVIVCRAPHGRGPRSVLHPCATVVSITPKHIVVVDKAEEYVYVRSQVEVVRKSAEVAARAAEEEQ